MNLINKEQLDNFSVTSQQIVRAAWQRKIEVYRFNERNILFLKKGKKGRWINLSKVSSSSFLVQRVLKDKDLTKRFLIMAGYAVPAGKVISRKKELAGVLKELGFPLVIKPATASEGMGVFANIRDKDVLGRAFDLAKRYDRRLLVERFKEGKYYRVIIINRRFYAAAQAEGAQIKGTGKETVEELVRRKNREPERKQGGRLKKIYLNEKARNLLLCQNLTVRSVPERGQKATLSFSGYDGGEWIDVTEDVSVENRRLLDNLGEMMDLKVAGVDLIVDSLEKSLKKGVILEINGAPYLDIHLRPTRGRKRDVVGAIIDMLFQD